MKGDAWGCSCQHWQPFPGLSIPVQAGGLPSCLPTLQTWWLHPGYSSRCYIKVLSWLPHGLQGVHQYRSPTYFPRPEKVSHRPPPPDSWLWPCHWVPPTQASLHSPLLPPPPAFFGQLSSVGLFLQRVTRFIDSLESKILHFYCIGLELVAFISAAALAKLIPFLYGQESLI